LNLQTQNTVNSNKDGEIAVTFILILIQCFNQQICCSSQ